MLLNCGVGEDFWEWLGLQRSNGSILKEISPEYSLEGPMLKLKLQYFTDSWTDSLEKTLMLGKIEVGGEGDDGGWDGWMASPTQWTWVWVSSGNLWWTGKPGMLQSMGLQRVGHDWVTELNWALISPSWEWHPLGNYFSSSVCNISRSINQSVLHFPSQTIMLGQ